MNFDLSYIISTRNRLPFLKITLEKLLDELQPGEEIVVVDANSTDGSKEYLQLLFDTGKIHQFISEPDKNQAHGWNKAMLMATGTIIKKIIDDDVFCYSAIRKCKAYMLQNPGVDVVISNDLNSTLNNFKKIDNSTRRPQFEKWNNGVVPSFTFGDSYMLIRRCALAYVGLYNTTFVMMDWEYALRISYLKVNIAYYTGYNALNVSHAGTITSLKNERLINKQGKMAAIIYEYAGDRAELSYWSKIKILVGSLIYARKLATFNISKEFDEGDINTAYNYYYDYIFNLDHSKNFTFLN